MTRLTTTGGDRGAWTLLGAHVALVALSTLALTTFLAGEPPQWLLEPASQRALHIGWTFSGPSYVVLGALATGAWLARRFGASRTLLLFALTAGVSLAAELIGTRTGYPFGAYAYTPLLGFRIAGRVPFPIPLSWFYMIAASLALVSHALPARDDARTQFMWALAGGAALTAWDVAMDPAMVVTNHWVWRTPGFFYGMPLSNWGGWLLTGTAIAWLALRVVPPTAIARASRDSRFPLVLYAVNAAFPIAICARHGFWWAAAGGIAATTLVVAPALAWRRHRVAVDNPRRATITAAA